MTQQPADASVVEADLDCIRCGYNLRTLTCSGQCPECGERVALSLPGRTLAAADARWLRAQWQGAMVQGIGLIVVDAILFVAGCAWGHSALVFYGVLPALLLASATAVLRMCRSEPGGPYHGDASWLRWLVRVVSVITAISLAGYAAIQWAERLWHYHLSNMVFWQAVLGIPGFAGGLVANSLIAWYFSRLAKRLPSRRLVVHGRWAAWSAVIVVAVMVVASIVLESNYRMPMPAWVINVVWMTLYSALLLWPAAYCLTWARAVRRAG